MVYSIGRPGVAVAGLADTSHVDKVTAGITEGEGVVSKDRDPTVLILHKGNGGVGMAGEAYLLIQTGKASGGFA